MSQPLSQTDEVDLLRLAAELVLGEEFRPDARSQRPSTSWPRGLRARRLFRTERSRRTDTSHLRPGERWSLAAMAPCDDAAVEPVIQLCAGPLLHESLIPGPSVGLRPRGYHKGLVFKTQVVRHRVNPLNSKVQTVWPEAPSPVYKHLCKKARP